MNFFWLYNPVAQEQVCIYSRTHEFDPTKFVVSKAQTTSGIHTPSDIYGGASKGAPAPRRKRGAGVNFFVSEEACDRYAAAICARLQQAGYASLLDVRVSDSSGLTIPVTPREIVPPLSPTMQLYFYPQGLAGTRVAMPEWAYPGLLKVIDKWTSKYNTKWGGALTPPDLRTMPQGSFVYLEGTQTPAPPKLATPVPQPPANAVDQQPTRPRIVGSSSGFQTQSTQAQTPITQALTQERNLPVPFVAEDKKLTQQIRKEARNEYQPERKWILVTRD